MERAIDLGKQDGYRTLGNRKTVAQIGTFNGVFHDNSRMNETSLISR
jgi:hypothetical protein